MLVLAVAVAAISPIVVPASASADGDASAPLPVTAAFNSEGGADALPIGEKAYEDILSTLPEVHDFAAPAGLLRADLAPAASGATLLIQNGWTISALPTKSGEAVCIDTVLAGSDTSSTGCFDRLNASTHIAWLAGQYGDVAHVRGLAADDVAAITVTSSTGETLPVTIMNNAFAWSGKAADGTPVSVTVQFVDGKSAVEQLPRW